MTRHVADLHCDLLYYLQQDPTRTPFNDEVRCSVSQLRAGQVRLQVMALYTETERGSAAKGLAQAEIFKLLVPTYPEDFQLLLSPTHLTQVLDSHRIGILAAIENASSFCEEEGPLEEGLNHLRTIFGKVGRPLYISLTWNSENRFGGGAHTSVGLKEDGRQLLNFLHEKQIAVDISHASDPLAFEIFDYIDAKNLQIPILASHSNARSVANVPRNLSDALIKEVVHRQGVIGLNMVKPFIGTNVTEGLIQQLETFFRLGAEDHLCFGADFFCDTDFPDHPFAKTPNGWYFPHFSDSSCYGHILDLWRDKLGISDEQLSKIAYENLFHFINQLWHEAQPVVQGIDDF